MKSETWGIVFFECMGVRLFSVVQCAFFVVLFYMKDSSSKSNYPLGGYIVVVFFTLVYRWCEVVQNADRRIC